MDLGKLAKILQAAKDQGYVAGDVSIIEPPPPPPPFENPPEDAKGGGQAHYPRMVAGSPSRGGTRAGHLGSCCFVRENPLRRSRREDQSCNCSASLGHPGRRKVGRRSRGRISIVDDQCYWWAGLIFYASVFSCSAASCA